MKNLKRSSKEKKKAYDKRKKHKFLFHFRKEPLIKKNIYILGENINLWNQ
jgi:hypothetical protein